MNRDILTGMKKWLRVELENALVQKFRLYAVGRNQTNSQAMSGILREKLKDLKLPKAARK